MLHSILGSGVHVLSMRDHSLANKWMFERSCRSGKITICIHIYIYMYSSLEWFMSPGTFSLFWTCIFHHISWYPWHILYSASSLFRWHPTVAESEVVEMENSTLNRAGVLWEDQDSISAGKSVLSIITATILYIHIDYKSSNNHSWYCWLNNLHPSLLNSSSFRQFEALWNQLAHLPTPRAKFEEPLGILPRASHLQQNSQPSWLAVPASVAEESVETGTEMGVKTWQFIFNYQFRRNLSSKKTS